MTARPLPPARLVPVVLVAALLAGCAGAIPPGFAPLPQAPDGQPRLELTYLGSGGWLIRRGPDAVATAPFVSNPVGLRLWLSATPKTEVIDRRVPAMPDVKIMLIGHTHYDHAMDLSRVLKVQAPEATLYGSRTMTHLLAPLRLREGRLRAVDAGAAAGDRPGRWYENEAGTLRFMPLRSAHAPHVLGLKLTSSKTLDADLAALPDAPLEWPEGEVLAFLIDFLGPGKAVEARLYYQDSASPPGLGILPALPPAEAARVDVAILCAANFDQVPGNPEHVLASVHPRHVVAGHWEDFIRRGADDPPRPVPGTSLAAFLRRVTQASPAPVYLPRPGERFSIPLTSQP